VWKCSMAGRNYSSVFKSVILRLFKARCGTHACNPSYSGDGDWEGGGSRSAQQEVSKVSSQQISWV
jgi:hypothetical protein